MNKSRQKYLSLLASCVLYLSVAVIVSCDEAEDETMPLTEVSLTEIGEYLSVGEIVKVIVIPDGEIVNGEQLIWSSNDASIAAVQSNESGYVVGVMGVAPGNATLTVTNQNGTVSASVQTQVIQKLEEITVAIEVDEDDKSMATAIASLIPANAMLFGDIIWSSSNESVATVDANGMVTAVAGPFSSITITATNAFSGLSGEKLVIVSGLAGSATLLTEFTEYCGIGTTSQSGDYFWAETISTTGAVKNLDHSDPNLDYTSPYEMYTGTGNELIVNPGTEINFALTIYRQYGTEEGKSWIRALVFIDWGNDFDFSNDGDLVATLGMALDDETGAVNDFDHSFKVSVPEGAAEGTVRMRVVAGNAWPGSHTPDNLIPCFLEGSHGVKDFNVVIQN